MKTRLFFFVLLGILFPLTAFCQSPEDLSDFLFEGNVKSCTVTMRYYYADTLMETSWRKVTINRSGTEKEFLYSNGKKEFQNTEQSSGRKRMKMIKKDASDKTIAYYESILDSAEGKIAKYTYTETIVNSVENKESTNTTIYEYDTTENKTYVTDYRRGTLYMQRVDTRDYYGLLVKSVYYYFGNGCEASENTGFLKGTKNTLSSSILYFYDTKGKLIQTIDYLYGIEGVISKKVNYFDKNQRLVKSCYYDSDDYLITEIKFSYDSKGMVTQKSFNHLDAEKPIKYEQKYKIIYDKQGNWISRKTFRDGKLEAELTREIEYWD